MTEGSAVFGIQLSGENLKPAITTRMTIGMSGIKRIAGKAAMKCIRRLVVLCVLASLPRWVSFPSSVTQLEFAQTSIQEIERPTLQPPHSESGEIVAPNNGITTDAQKLLELRI